MATTSDIKRKAELVMVDALKARLPALARSFLPGAERDRE